MTMPKYHQLKKEVLAMISWGDDSLNWSAANVWMHGLCPPSPMDVMYSAMYNNNFRFCSLVTDDADTVSKIVPCVYLDT